jgi:hypothetical protein
MVGGGDLCPPLSPFAAPSPSQECLARGAWPQQHGQTANTGDGRSIVFLHPIRHRACRRSWTNRRHRSGFTVIAGGYVDDRAKPERLRFPCFPRKKERGKHGNARLRPHTHRHNNIKEEYFQSKGRGAQGRGLTSKVPPCGRACAARAVPDQKAGPVFFAQGERAKKSSVPRACPRF